MVVIVVDRSRSLVDEPLAKPVHQYPVRIEIDDRVGLLRAWIGWLGMPGPEVACRCGADLQCHTDAFALVVVAALGDGTDVFGAPAEILRQHRGVSLEATAGEHHGGAPDIDATTRTVAGAHADHVPLLVGDQRGRRMLIEEGRAMLPGIG